MRNLLSTVAAIAATVAGQMLVAALMQRQGFVAISDDDFARVAIAQRFVEDPSLDPSGTSWLPLPFILSGGILSLLGPSLTSARIAAVVFACVAAVGLYQAGRFVGTRRTFAVAAAYIAMTLPYAARLSVATVPEYLAAGFMVMGLCSLSQRPHRQSKRRRTVDLLVGAVALFVATGSRYEAWPVAAVFFLVVCFDAWKERRFVYWLPALVSVSFPALWLLHGALHHGDPFFFVERVVNYKQALQAGSAQPWQQALMGYPRAVVVHEPQVIAAALVTSALAGYFVGLAPLAASMRPAFGLLVLLLVLVAGDLAGGGPTHHPERAVLTIWLFSAVVVARNLQGISGAYEPGRARWRLLATVAITAALAALAWQLRPLAGKRTFAQRGAELSIGSYIHDELDPTARIAIHTPGYGYFAVMASSGRPDRFRVVEDHDPRDDVASEPKPAVKALLNGRYCYAVAPEAWTLENTVQLTHAAPLALYEVLDCKHRQH